jgi:hypothetical protein
MKRAVLEPDHHGELDQIRVEHHMTGGLVDHRGILTA